MRWSWFRRKEIPDPDFQSTLDEVQEDRNRAEDKLRETLDRQADVYRAVDRAYRLRQIDHIAKDLEIAVRKRKPA